MQIMKIPCDEFYEMLISFLRYNIIEYNFNSGVF